MFSPAAQNPAMGASVLASCSGWGKEMCMQEARSISSSETGMLRAVVSPDSRLVSGGCLQPLCCFAPELLLQVPATVCIRI